MVTAWGDEQGTGYLSDNPATFNITDSDNELILGPTQPNVRTYGLQYNGPAGEGWYLPTYDVYPTHPFIMNVAFLVQGNYSLPADCYEAVKVVGSYRLTQVGSTAATGLDYRAGTDVGIYWYETHAGVEGDSTATPVPGHDPPWAYDFEWTFDEPVPQGTQVTIFTEFAECVRNAIYYRDVSFTYDSRDRVQAPGGAAAPRDITVPAIQITVDTEDLSDTDIPNICGGQVVGAFELYSDEARTTLLGEFRFEHEYNWDQDPEHHWFTVALRDNTPCWVGDVRFGHSHGFLDQEALWEFEEWFEVHYGTAALTATDSISYTLSWDGRLPYPPMTSGDEQQLDCIDHTCWSVQDVDLFQDNFPTNGTSAGAGRIDMARLLGLASGAVLGDSAVVSVYDSLGIAEDNSIGGPAVYFYLHRAPATKPVNPISAVENAFRWPMVDSTTAADGRLWYRFRMDSCFTDPAGPGTRTGYVPDRYCIDVNDNYFENGDTLWFVFGSRNVGDEFTWWSQSAGAVSTLDEACAAPMEMQILPGAGPGRGGDILYVDNFGNRAARADYDWAFKMMGLDQQVDRFDKRGASLAVGNGLGNICGNAEGQLIPNYRKIIWDSGNLKQGTVGDGTGAPELSDDFALLSQFLNNHTNSSGCGVYLTGDNLAEEWAGFSSASAVNFQATYMPHDLITGDHKPLHGGSPFVIGETGGIFTSGSPIMPDTLVAYQDWRAASGPADFDQVKPKPGAVLQMTYRGTHSSTDGAVLSYSTSNYNGPVGVVLSSFSYHAIRDDRPQNPMDRVEHLYRILTWLGNAIDEPTGSEAALPFRDYLAQNFPNPFNPYTTIRYSIRERSHVTLRIYNVAGQLVRTLVDGEQLPRAEGFTIKWDGRNETGEAVATGVYLYRLVTKQYTQTRKLVLLK